MPASKPGIQVRFRADEAAKIAARKKKDWTETEKASFFGVTQSNWSRVTGEEGKASASGPGALFIAAVLTSPAAEEYPRLVTFQNLFEVVRS